MSEEVIETPVSEVTEVIPTNELLETPVVETAVVTEQPEVVEYSEDEQLAMSKGWVPKDKFKGDLSKYKGAKAFLKDGELFEFAKYAKKKIKELEATVQHVTSKQQQTEVRTQESMLNDLKRQQREAASIGDVDTVTKVTDQILAIQSRPAVDPVAQREMKAREESNAFFERHPELANPADPVSFERFMIAKAKDIELSTISPNLDPTLQFQLIEQALSAHDQKSQSRIVKQEPVSRSVVEPATHTAPRSKKVTINDFDPLQQQIIRSIQKEDPNYSLEKHKEELQTLGVI